MTCPNVEFCAARVKLEHYKQYCLSDEEWRGCKFYVEVEMLPSHWKKYVKDESGLSGRMF